MKQTIIAAAQTIPFKGEVAKNIESHSKLIRMASDHNVQLIVFPELSLTGYEPTIAESIAFSVDDERLVPLKELAAEKNIIIIAGAPTRIDESLHIGAFIIYPNYSIAVYTKHYLHPGEEKVYSPGNNDAIIYLDNEIISPAICADTNNPLHAEAAAEKGSTIYAAGSFITPSGYAGDTGKLIDYAAQYNMAVFFSNFGGSSGGMETAGQSAVWSPTGLLLSKLGEKGEGLAIGIKNDTGWAGKAIEV